ncbi:heat shock protein binding protein, putative [Ricinus communis]|uniref:Heat shock protein binding protein, putative n=2 Tax=Ricinus communis TaxID=3988 RepID=B9SUQ4_RICCO|nr:heat shock protein binding protein, putative [Ricinus communis]
MVERSDLSALEFLMSKQPRGNVRVGASHTGGARVSNIFVDVKKFQTRFVDAMNKANSESSKETDLQREVRISAIQAIRSISNWLYWQSPKASESKRQSLQNLPQIAQKSTEPNIDKLRQAAAARKQANQSTSPIANIIYHDEYWIPSTAALPASTNNSAIRATPEALHAKDPKHLNEEDFRTRENQRDPLEWRIPMSTGIIAAVIVHSQVSQHAVGGLNGHVGGALALEVVNSSWLQVTLAGITWYLFGVATIQLVEAIRKRF